MSKTVLIVEDNELNRKLFNDLLEAYGYRTLKAVDGKGVLGPVDGVPGLHIAIPGDAGYTLGPLSAQLVADMALARDPGVVWTRDDLLENVWGTDFPGETRTVDVHVSALRARLAPDGPAIEAVKGVGYRLVPPARDLA